MNCSIPAGPSGDCIPMKRIKTEPPDGEIIQVTVPGKCALAWQPLSLKIVHLLNYKDSIQRCSFHRLSLTFLCDTTSHTAKLQDGVFDFYTLPTHSVRRHKQAFYTTGTFRPPLGTSSWSCVSAQSCKSLWKINVCFPRRWHKWRGAQRVCGRAGRRRSVSSHSLALCSLCSPRSPCSPSPNGKPCR